MSNTETKSKCTPGMWRPFSLGDGRPAVVSSEGELIAIISPDTPETINANAHLIVTAVNACKSINPDNPLAVAQNLKEVVEALEDQMSFHKDELERFRGYAAVNQKVDYSRELNGHAAQILKIEAALNKIKA